MLLIMSPCPVAVDGRRYHVDRKFHEGMLRYRELLGPVVACAVPAATAADAAAAMDSIELRPEQVPYEVRQLAGDSHARPTAEVQRRIGEMLAGVSAVAGPGGPGIPAAVFDAAAGQGIAVVPIVEANRRCLVEQARLSVDRPLRRLVRMSRANRHWRIAMQQVRRATAAQCNGYQAYIECGRYARERLLYLDSRLSAADVVAAERIARRVRSLAEGRRLRLVFSGRFEALKGPMDAVRIGLELHRRGSPFRLQLFGKGSQRAALEHLVKQAGAQHAIEIHGSLPFPDLLRVTAQADAFLCCHPQEDPSCTYLEVMGCGVPIVGFANGTWKALAAASGGGVVVPLGGIRAAARAVRHLVRSPDKLLDLSLAARHFAEQHCFEREWIKRCEHLRPWVRGASPPRAATAGAPSVAAWAATAAPPAAAPPTTSATAAPATAAARDPGLVAASVP
jgi:glycosyltransferase involved in cell wall biosynthesis